MKKTLSALSVLFIAAIFFAACNSTGNASNEAVQLKLNLEKGKTYNYGLTTHFDMNMEMMGQKIASGGDVDYGYKLNVADIDAQGNTILNSTIDAIKFKMSAMGINMGYDSKNVGDTTKEDKMSNMFRRIFGGMMGKTFKMTVSPKGEIVKIEGIDEMLNAMIEGMPGSVEDKAKMRKQMGQSFNADQIKQSFSQAFTVFPDKPVKVGDTWTKNVTYGINGMNNTVDMNFKVKDIKPDEVLLDVTGDIKAAQDMRADTILKKPSFNLTGKELGTMVINRTTGLPKKADIDMTMKGNMEMQGNKIPMDMKTKITITGN